MTDTSSSTINSIDQSQNISKEKKEYCLYFHQLKILLKNNKKKKLKTYQK